MYQGNSAVQNASGVDMNNTHVTKETILGGLKNLGNLFLGKEMTNLEDTYRHSDTYAGATQGQKNEFNARSNALMA
jgi:hypothetical protein